MIAYHGWGYDRHFWKPWGALLSQQEMLLKCFDRGYFGDPCKPSFTGPGGCKVIFAHSYGLHLCPPQQLRIADVVVVFAGFVHFHPKEPRKQRRSQRILHQMIHQFQRDPQAVLDAFWQNCGLDQPVPPSPAAIQTQLLLHDLQDLGQSLLCADFLARRPKLILVQGQQDRIVDPDRAPALLQALGPHAQLMTLEGPHALPATQPQACWEQLRWHFQRE